MTSNKYQAILERDKQYRHMNTKNRNQYVWDKFAYSSKRRAGTKNSLVSVISIIVSLILSLFIAMIIYQDGSLFYRIIVQIFIAPFNSSNWKSTMSTIAILVVAVLSFVFFQKVCLFNLGFSGQMLFGAQLATLISWFLI